MKKKVTDLEIVTDVLCLNFINTADWHATDHPSEYLERPEDFVLWCFHVGLINRVQVEILRNKVFLDLNRWKSFLTRVIRLREILYRIFFLWVKKRTVDKSDLTSFNSFFTGSMRYARIQKNPEGFIITFPEPEIDFRHLLHPIVQSTLNLLTSEKLNLIKQCADPMCGWFFIDSSKNRSRRWCSMKDCGNRTKARRFYYKKRKQNQ